MSYIAIECKQNHLPHVALRDDFLCYEPRTCRTVTNTTKASAVKQPKVKPLCLYPERSINLHGIHTAHQILSILMAVYFVQKPCVKMAIWNFTWIYALDKFLAVECYQSPSAPLLATKQMSIFNNNKKVTVRPFLSFKDRLISPVACVSGAMASLFTRKGLQWCSSQGSQRRTKACTPAVRPSITMGPLSGYRWRSRARTSSSVRACLFVSSHMSFILVPSVKDTIIVKNIIKINASSLCRLSVESP